LILTQDELPEFDNISTTYFLDLRLNDKNNIEIANNLYWLSSKPDVLDYEAKVEPWPYHTPSKEFADFTLLNSLPCVKVNVEHRFKAIGKNTKVTAKLENISPDFIGIAFFIELKVSGKKSGEAILPIFWEDNYISLLPGESRKIEAVFAVRNDEPVLTVNGWNLEVHNL
jgi:exo-1,4-beta-D-glucosaminidase